MQRLEVSGAVRPLYGSLGVIGLISSNFLFHCHILGLKFFYTLSFQKYSIAFYLALLVPKFLMHMLMFCVLLCSLVLILIFCLNNIHIVHKCVLKFQFPIPLTKGTIPITFEC